MDKLKLLWQRPYLAVMWTCGLFIGLTIIAMFFYPGGAWTNPQAEGYHFFQNFFSDLGMWTAHNGVPNPVSATLFFLALTLAGLGLVLFFLTFPRFFAKYSLVLKGLSWLGMLVGVWSGISFVGIAFTPADIFLEAHANFVYSAFLSLPVAIFIFAIAVWRHHTFPNRYAAVLFGFTVCLLGYIWLLFFGPSGVTAQGFSYQATGQKLIVYIALASMFMLATGARKQMPQADG
ncbi:MAG: hypothetical protein CL608_06275 [Anaerolineaceae bacterium]|nr:hypothetical protein [Anaerolineaceae bacterium]